MVSAGCGEQAVPDAALAEKLLVDLGPNRGIGRAIQQRQRRLVSLLLKWLVEQLLGGLKENHPIN
jgi:hypothetical protein